MKKETHRRGKYCPLEDEIVYECEEWHEGIPYCGDCPHSDEDD